MSEVTISLDVRIQFVDREGKMWYDEGNVRMPMARKDVLKLMDIYKAAGRFAQAAKVAEEAGMRAEAVLYRTIDKLAEFEQHEASQYIASEPILPDTSQ